MAVKKENLRYSESNFYKKPTFEGEPLVHIVDEEDLFDPGRLTHIYDLPFNSWPLILRFNDIVDYIEEVEAGDTLLIPSIKDLKNIELSV